MRKIALRRRRRSSRDQRGLTLIELMIAVVIMSMVITPAMGFISLSMVEQAEARFLTTEANNVAALDVALMQDVTNAKAAQASPTGPGAGGVRDCPTAGLDSDGGDAVLGLVSSENQRVVYSLGPPPSNPQLGRAMWRRTCPNNPALATQPSDGLDDSPLVSTDSAATTESRLADRVGNAISSCPKADPTGLAQDNDCRQVKMTLWSVDRTGAGNDRTPVVVQATRRTNSYAAPGTQPIAYFTYRPQWVEDHMEVTFDGTGSRDPRGGPLAYNWDFVEPVGTGGTPTPWDIAYSTSPTHQKVTVKIPMRPNGTTPPDMAVTLRVRNGEATVSEPFEVQVPIHFKNPTASIAPGPPIQVTRTSPFEFTPNLQTYSGATIAETTWDWGDGSAPEPVCPPGGTSCTTKRPHTFMEAGVKFVKVSVLDTQGNRATAQVAVTVLTETIYVSNAVRAADTPVCGTISSPCKTINHGLTRAASLGKMQVLVSGGTYGRFSARSNINVIGKWDDTTATGLTGTVPVITGGDNTLPHGIFASAVTNATIKDFWVNTSTPPDSSIKTQGILVGNGAGTASTITFDTVTVVGGQSNEPAGVLIQNGSNVTLNNMNITSPTAVGRGSSAYGVRVHGLSTLRSTDSTFTAKPGIDAPTVTNTVPDQAGPGCNGKPGSTGSGNPGESCGQGSGRGGQGQGDYFNHGSPGSPGADPGGAGGAGGGNNCGNWIPCTNAYSGQGGGAGPQDLETGGQPGLAGSNDGGAAGMLYVGRTGGSGGSGGDGRPGGGGGGGGGNAWVGDHAGGGGSGGGGGRGGTGGIAGGASGGGSFGIYAHNSNVTVVGGTLDVASGGQGSKGQPGGPGGNGGNGGNGADDLKVVGVEVVEGGGGGGPGSGGGGGGGAGGGPGGPSICIMRVGGAGSVQASPTCTRPVGASGGGGGTWGAAGGPGDRGWGDDDHYGGWGNAGVGGNSGNGGNAGRSADWYTP